MDANEMVLPGGVDRFEAEQALDTLMRADVIVGDTRMMKAVSVVAEQKKRVLDAFSPEEVRVVHKDANRKGRTTF